MRIKIWGARGSIPSPARPGEIREKLVSALLGISQIADGELREELMAALVEAPQFLPQADPSPPEQTGQLIEEKRRQVVERYLDSLPSLQVGTAGGNTPCIEIQAGDDLFIIDAGSGIRQLGLELMKGRWGQGQGVIHLFFSHPHWDHIQGFPFFRPAFIPGNKIYIYSVHNIEQALRRQQEFISFPVSLDYMQADMIFRRLKPEESLEFGNLRVRLMRNHHPGDAYSFRFEKTDKVFVYASDAAYPIGTDLRPFINFFADADVLMFDTQFTQQESDEKEDWGHSSSLVGLEMAQLAKAKNLVLFHHNSAYNDTELAKILENTLKLQQTQYPGGAVVKVVVAQEEQTFDLTPPQAMQLQLIPGSKTAIFKPTGIFNERTAAELRRQLADLQQTCCLSQLIIDMSRVDLLQVVGLRDLVKLRKEQPSITVVLAGPSLSVQQLIDLVGYLDFFAVYPSVHAAITALQARETRDLPGQTLKNRYTIESRLMDGWLGTTFKATDTRLNQVVAIKTLSASFSEAAIERFLRHAREIVDLDHPNIVNIMECDEDHGLSFMVEEFIEGRTLRDMLTEQAGRPLPLATGMHIAISIARALEYAHANGVIHGDLKPSNVLLANGVIKVSDFGLGRLESGKSLLNLEMPLALVSAQYLAPEQALGHPIDARTDLYALGALLYELFTGQPLFSGTEQEILEQHLNRAPQSLRQLNPTLSRSLEHLILKLLDKDPNKRYPTVRQVRRILVGMAMTAKRTATEPFSALRWPTLIGRADSLAQLQQAWGNARAGQGQVVILQAETGLGKTRLMQELVDQAGDAVLLNGYCLPPEISSAYQPFLEALNAYFALTPQAQADSPVGQVLSQAIHLIPEIQALLPYFQPPSRSTANHHPNFVDTLKQVTAQRPWLVIIDDAHWIDAGSLRLLEYLARHSEQAALMIVVAYSQELAAHHPLLTETLHHLKRLIECTEIQLDNLERDEVRQLLEAIWGQPVPPDLVAATFRRTQGNPWFVEEITKDLVNEGIAVWREGHWHFASVVETRFPQNLAQAITRRMHRLNKETQTLLQQAAVLGYSFSFDELQVISALPEETILDYLDIALESHLLRDIADAGLLRFYHPRTQQVLAESLNASKQRQFHREMAEALQQHRFRASPQPAPHLAYHFLKARELGKGLAYCLEAAGQAKALWDNQTALHWYNLALETLDQLNDTLQTRQQRFELLLAREEIYRQLDETALQAADLAALQTLAQALSNPTWQAAAHLRQAQYERANQQPAQAIAEAQAALIAARQAKNRLLEGESLRQLGYISLHLSQTEMARAHMHDAYDLIESAGRPPAQAESLNGLGDLYNWLKDYPRAENYYQQALALSQAHTDRDGQATSLQNLGALRLAADQYDQAIACYRQALTLNQLMDHHRDETTCWQNLVTAYKKSGQLQPGQPQAEMLENSA